ncbi:Panacea domain-containing protein [Paenibacillus macerans]|uniref:Antitoxin SocA-like Panacea domain-containing protein n=1 Tax=Paenibacillus macerans TaxID=44252 RepID=A0A090YLB1_PAEMA|nr:type II toxin-antitoxin system antitoxin SocA domain-containing protein [Paenibacillus macerans]KFM92960.1 hypothetical protein DJ90_2920 [Paenibacillus macerans]MCY7558536.1 DUF4065 domain-containing protein [Paenibacillus macerans]MEC0153956.1 DUF4065 domain-containing protein [Paenibacillus macerans]SUA84772.1 Uncharacterized phage-associated protein [Paenibacillus macerans]
MAFHFIAISSDYALGRRIGWHYSSDEKLDMHFIEQAMERIKLESGDIHLAIHKLSTDSILWDSVVEKDSFFADVIITDNLGLFIEQLTRGTELKAYDVAKFILSIMPTTHLMLQKLLYYAYAGYLLNTGKKLFKEPIVAFKYGPVVEDVYYKFRHNGASRIEFGEEDEGTFYLQQTKSIVPPSFVRILMSEDGITSAKCIIDTLKEYHAYSAGDLVEKTHRPGGPWERVYREGLNSIITDDLIKEYHSLVV